MDQLSNKDTMTFQQEREGFGAVTMFRRFQFGVVVTTPELARKAVNSTLKESSETAGVEMFVSEVDFRDPDSINHFLIFWEENEELLKDLHEGYLVPKDIKQRGHDKYPVFLFINPSNLAYFSEDVLESKEKSDNAMSKLRKICKFGRVQTVFTPDFFQETGTLWANVPEAYQKAIKHPEDVDNKLKIAKYLYARGAVEKLGLQQHVENPMNIFTPTSEALEKSIIQN